MHSGVSVDGYCQLHLRIREQPCGKPVPQTSHSFQTVGPGLKQKRSRKTHCPRRKITSWDTCNGQLTALRSRVRGSLRGGDLQLAQPIPRSWGFPDPRMVVLSLTFYALDEAHLYELFINYLGHLFNIQILKFLLEQSPNEGPREEPWWRDFTECREKARSPKPLFTTDASGLWVSWALPITGCWGSEPLCLLQPTSHQQYHVTGANCYSYSAEWKQKGSLEKFYREISQHVWEVKTAVAARIFKTPFSVFSLWKKKNLSRL